MSTSRLKIYNEALRICGETKLASLTENREARYALDDIWDNDGVKSCLEDGQWKFAKRSVQLDFDPAYDPEFGYRHAFAKPSDWCATMAVCDDEYFNSPLLQYGDETGFWYCDLEIIYVQYVSNDAAYGGDLSLWPVKFADFVAAHFAWKIIHTLTGDQTKQLKVMGIRDKSLRIAKNHDAMADPTKFPPDGSWVNARRGRGGSFRRDRGSRNTLIG